MKSLIEIIYSPVEFFSNFKEKGSVLPLVLLLLIPVIYITLYLLVMDFSWYVEMFISTEMSEDDAESIQAFRSFASQNFMIISSAAGVVLASLVAVLLLASYIKLIGELLSLENIKALAAASWVLLPMAIFDSMSMIFMLLDGSDQLSLNQTDLSLVSTVFGFDESNITKLLALDIFWSAGLMFLYFFKYIKTSALKSLFLALIPYICYLLMIWFQFV